VETLQLTDHALPLRKRATGFWRRQFHSETTSPQIVFDVVLGAIAPVLCYLFDPIVFSSQFDRPLFPDYQTFVYMLSAVQIVLLCGWLVLRPKNPIGSGMIAGALLGGGIFCLVTGLILAPFSLIGLMFGIGIFGFTPFVTAFVYIRNSIRASRVSPARSHFETGIIATAGFLLAVALPLALSLAIHSAATNAVNDVIHGDAQRASFAAQRLIPLRYFSGVEMNRIAEAYVSEQDPQKREQLRDLYRQITGDDLRCAREFFAISASPRASGEPR
jgi:hypothetical protein